MTKNEKIELLEARLTDLRDEVYYQLSNGLPSLHRLKEEECRATAALMMIHEID